MKHILAFLIAMVAITGPVFSQSTGALPIISSYQVSALNGQGFWSGSTATTFLTGGNLRYAISNPSASGVNCLAYELHIYTTATSLAHFWFNPTVGPSTSKPVNNLLIGGGNTNRCTVKADSSTTAMSGGTDSGIDLGIPVGLLDLQSQTIIVPPGMTLGINIPITGSATASATVFWRESAIGAQ